MCPPDGSLQQPPDPGEVPGLHGGVQGEPLGPQVPGVGCHGLALLTVHHLYIFIGHMSPALTASTLCPLPGLGATNYRCTELLSGPSLPLATVQRCVYIELRHRQGGTVEYGPSFFSFSTDVISFTLISTF